MQRRWGFDPFDARFAKPNYLHQLCTDEDVETLRSILKGDNSGVNGRDYQDYTPLQVVVTSVDQPLMSVLMELLITHSADINATEQFGGNTSLHLTILYAKKTSAELAVGILLKLGALPSPINKVGRTPFDYALANGYRELAQLIACVEEDPNYILTFDPYKWTNYNKYTADILYKYIDSGHIDGAAHVMTKLSKDEASQSLPLHEAVGRAPDKPTMITVLVRNGADVTATDPNGDTAIQNAIKTLPHNREMLRTIQALMNGGVPVSQTDNDRLTAVELARSKKYDDVVELLTTGLIPDTSRSVKPSKPLVISPKKEPPRTKEPEQEKTPVLSNRTNENVNEFTGNFHKVHEILLQKGKSGATISKELKTFFDSNPGLDVNLRSKDKNGDTPLHIAVRREKKDCVQYLISQHATINIKNRQGDTPLYLSRYGPFGGNKEIEELLMKANRIQIAEARWKRQNVGATAVRNFQRGAANQP